MPAPYAYFQIPRNGRNTNVYNAIDLLEQQWFQELHHTKDNNDSYGNTTLSQIKRRHKNGKCYEPPRRDNQVRYERKKTPHWVETVTMRLRQDHTELYVMRSKAKSGRRPVDVTVRQRYATGKMCYYPKALAAVQCMP
eukprot:3264249-Amphidinium_carterae.1